MPTNIVAEEQQEEDIPCKKATPIQANLANARQVIKNT